MKADFFNKEFNYQNISHAYLFECKPSKKFNEEINNLIKKILCVDKQKNFMFCDLCSSCKSFNGNSNPDFLEIFPDEGLKSKVIGISTLRGDGEYIMKIRRFVPDFVSQTGNTQVTLNLKNYSNDTAASSSLGPFTVSSSTTKVDTRARARAIALKIENTSTSQDWKLGTFRLDIQPDGRR